jgi:hypothetical protein
VRLIGEACGPLSKFKRTKFSDLRFRALLTEGRFEVLFHREELDSLADIRKSV